MREKIDKLPDNLSGRGLKKVDQEKNIYTKAQMVVKLYIED